MARAKLKVEAIGNYNYGYGRIGGSVYCVRFNRPAILTEMRALEVISASVDIKRHFNVSARYTNKDWTYDAALIGSDELDALNYVLRLLEKMYGDK